MARVTPQDDNYAAGFGEVKDRDVTSEWSRWVTFAGDVGVWAGQPFEKRVQRADGAVDVADGESLHDKSKAKPKRECARVERH